MKGRFTDFLHDFCSTLEGETSQTGSQARMYRDYLVQAGTMVAHDTTTMYVDWIHLLEFDAELSEVISSRFFLAFHPARLTRLLGLPGDRGRVLPL
jgi:hypothetical protein